MKAHLLFIVSFCLTIQTSVCQIITNGVIAYYTFDGDANDHSGNNRNPTNQALPSYSLNRLGQNSKALYLDNSNTTEAVCYIEYPATPFSLTGAFSFSLWFARDGGYINPRLFEIGVDGCGINAGFDGTTGLVFYTKCQGIKVPVPITNGQWYHLAGTYDGTSSLKLYLNGQLIGEKNDVTGSAVYDTPFNIGRKPTPYHDGYKGKIDDLVFYNRALSQQEVTRIFADDQTTTNPPGGGSVPYVSLVRNHCSQSNIPSTFQHFTPFNGYLYYNAYTCQSEGIWRTDGTGIGSNLVTGQTFDFLSSSRCVSGGHLYYGNTTGLRRINGVTGADELVKGGIFYPRFMVDFNGILVFSSNGNGIWRSDGTEAGTYQLPGVPASSIGLIVTNGTRVFAVANAGAIYETDGNSVGILRSESCSVSAAAIWEGVLIGFDQLQDENGNASLRLGRWDNGAFTPLHSFGDANSPQGGQYAFFRGSDGLYFFARSTYEHPGGNNAAIDQLWRTDGTLAGTFKVAQLGNETVSAGYYFLQSDRAQPHENIFFFPAGDATTGIELWRSDGTEGGTFLVKDIFPGSEGSFPSEISVIDGICYFIANDGAHGSEVWRSDGTFDGTFMVSDLNPGSASGAPLESISNTNTRALAHNGRYYFMGNSPDAGIELYATGGEAPVTVKALIGETLGWCDHCEKDLFKVSSINDKNRYMAYTMGDTLTASAGKFDVSWNESIWKGQYSEKTTFTGATWASNPTFTINGLNTSPKPPCSGWSRGFSMSGDCTIPTLSVITPSGGPVIDVASIVTIASVNSKNTYEIPVTGGAPGQKVRIVWNSTLSRWELILIDPSMRTASEIVLSTNQGDQRSNPLCAGWTNGYGLAGDVCNSLPLPVKLISFNASVENSSVILNWKTSEESNSLYYAIERSKNMKIFEQVAQLDAAGNTQNLSTYTHTDENPLKGISYYRLRQVDNDGKVMLSRTVSVRISGSNVPYPNPTDGYAIRVKASDLRKLTLTDVTGKNVPFDARRLDGEIFEILPKTRLTSGLYIMWCDGASYKFIVN